jgi:hypothetical protein
MVARRNQDVPQDFPMSHPDPNGPPDTTPVRAGEVWENPVTRERATILELPQHNPERRAVAELVARVGARVIGEHRHPAIVERFTVLDGELTVKRPASCAKARPPPLRPVCGTTGGMRPIGMLA